MDGILLTYAGCYDFSLLSLSKRARAHWRVEKFQGESAPTPGGPEKVSSEFVCEPPALAAGQRFSWFSPKRVGLTPPM